MFSGSLETSETIAPHEGGKAFALDQLSNKKELPDRLRERIQQLIEGAPGPLLVVLDDDHGHQTMFRIRVGQDTEAENEKKYIYLLPVAGNLNTPKYRPSAVNSYRDKPSNESLSSLTIDVQNPYPGDENQLVVRERGIGVEEFLSGRTEVERLFGYKGASSIATQVTRVEKIDLAKALEIDRERAAPIDDAETRYYPIEPTDVIDNIIQIGDELLITYREGDKTLQGKFLKSGPTAFKVIGSRGPGPVEYQYAYPDALSDKTPEDEFLVGFPGLKRSSIKAVVAKVHHKKKPPQE